LAVGHRLGYSVEEIARNGEHPLERERGTMLRGEQKHRLPRKGCNISRPGSYLRDVPVPQGNGNRFLLRADQHSLPRQCRGERKIEKQLMGDKRMMPDKRGFNPESPLEKTRYTRGMSVVRRRKGGFGGLYTMLANAPALSCESFLGESPN